MRPVMLGQPTSDTAIVAGCELEAAVTLVAAMAALGALSVVTPIVVIARLAASTAACGARPGRTIRKVCGVIELLST